MGRECSLNNQIMAIQIQRMGKYLKIFERQMRKVTNTHMGSLVVLLN